MDNVLISVLVATFNSEDTIIETLDSIRSQTYEKLELIIADDASTDNTLEIVEGWIEQNGARFVAIKRAYSKRNRGVTLNVNSGIALCEGEYIQAIAGDDLLVKNAIELKLHYAVENGSDIVFCKVKVFGDNFKSVCSLTRFRNRGYKIVESGYEKQRKEMIRDNFICGPSYSFYKRTYIKERGPFDERFNMLEDYPFLFKYVVKEKKTIVFLNEELMLYRASGKSLCTSNNIQFNQSQKSFFWRVRAKELLRAGEFKELWKQMQYFSS